MERWLNDWIMNYVDGDPANSSQETKSRKPLAAAEVQVEEIEDNPGYYSAKFFLRPHYQLEGLTVSPAPGVEAAFAEAKRRVLMDWSQAAIARPDK